MLRESIPREARSIWMRELGISILSKEPVIGRVI
jgi:hypothetical protein